MPLPDTKAPLLKVDAWIGNEVNIHQGTHLIDFWNYSCPGCRRMASKLDELHSSIDSLNVVGIHVPEFGFEEERENVEKAVEKLGIGYSVALDRGATHRDYGNRQGSQRVLVHDGNVVWSQAGHSGFDRLARKIEELAGEDEEVPGIEEETPLMIYLGFRKGRGVNEEGVFRGEKKFGLPVDRKKGEIYLEGEWTMEEDYIEAGKNARLFFKTDKTVSAVIDPQDSIKDVELLIGGEKVGEDKAGEDLRLEESSYARVKHPGLYSLFEPETVSEAVLDVEEGVRLHALSLE